MHRPSSTVLQEVSLKEALIVGYEAIVNIKDNLCLIYTWDRHFIGPLLEYAISNHSELNKSKGREAKYTQFAIELFVAKLMYFHPYFLEKGVALYCGYSLADTQAELLIKKLEVLNILVLVPNFPCEIIDPVSPPLKTALQRVYWLNVQPFLHRNKSLEDFNRLIETQFAKEQLSEQVKSLRDFLYDIQNQRQSINGPTQQFIRIKDYTPPHQSSAACALRTEQLLVLVSLDQELPEDIGEFIEVWVDKSMEYNSLVGNYVCTERFGEFVWMKGPLVYALEKGIVLVMNNFQQASNELVVAVKNIVNNGYLYVQNLGQNVYAKLGFKMLGIANQPIFNITSVNEPRKNPLELIPQDMPHYSREYFTELLEKHQQLGFRKLQKLWRRVSYRRKQLLQQEERCAVEELWKGHLTEHFKQMVHEELEEIMNIYRPQGKQLQYCQTNRRLKLGRIELLLEQQQMPSRQIVHTQYSLRIMEKLLMSVIMDESVLLVSETGCGKTTLVQHVAQLLGKKLYVFNMSLGSDVNDFVGGFKPVDCIVLLEALLLKYIKHFNRLPSQNNNQKYLTSLMTLFKRGEHKTLLETLLKSFNAISKVMPEEVKLKWQKLQKRLMRMYENIDRIKSNLVFMFLQGNLLKALKNGDWILIDEINLASNEMLQKIVPLISGKSITLFEKGDLKNINRHPNFRLFGCMNPGNDFGKKSLPANLLDKFTIFTLPEPDKIDVQLFISSKCPSLNAVELTNLYMQLKKKKVLSLRNLSRALSYININRQFYGQRAVYDGLLLGFGEKSMLNKYECKQPANIPREGYAFIEGFWVKRGNHPNQSMETQFKLTSKFKQHLTDLLRAVAGTDLPVLLEGPTSAGKTTMIRYIASLSNHKCIRINNHEHTDVQEYLGSYYPSAEGSMIFREGVLVEAVRNGYWLILDELNLARSEILECLNRLLDDNRELFLPESQKHLKPHPGFRIFATQNPSSYSGRKNLSKAFRNRFVQILMNEISPEDTVDILAKRVPLIEDSKQLREYMLRVINELTRYRLREKVFIKDAIVTIRDLLKWTSRSMDPNNLKEALALEGYSILAERLRTQDQKQYIKTVLLGKDKANFDELQHYSQYAQEHIENIAKEFHIQMNSGFKRMAALTLKAYFNNEPTLLVGETGSGKTTLAEMIAHKSTRPFYSINCHKHTQASDFIGCLRPTARNQTRDQPPFEFVDGVLLKAMQQGAVLLIDEINTAQDSVLERMNEVFEGGGIGVERGSGWEVINAKPGFYIIATMNPSGDFGKKQLSPALRNRFTQIWVEPVTHPKYLSMYLKSQTHNDLKELVSGWLSHRQIEPANIPNLLFQFVCNFNLELANKYNLQKKMLTMRDIVWILNFIHQSKGLDVPVVKRYGWALWILTVEGSEFYSLPQTEKYLIKDELKRLIDKQTQVNNLDSLNILKTLAFPLLITTDLPLKLLGIEFSRRIFFNPQTELSDLLGQYRPEGKNFRWIDGELLTAVKEGGTIALADLNLAQQQVVEGINSLFDYRGSIYVVDIGQTFHKASTFRPVVVLKTKVEGDRKMLPNSFLNRFVKLHIKQFSVIQKIDYLRQNYSLNNEVVEKLSQFMDNLSRTIYQPSLSQLELFCEIQRLGCLKQALRAGFIRPYGIEPRQLKQALKASFNYESLPARVTLVEQIFLRHLPLIRNTFRITSHSDLELLSDIHAACRANTTSLCLKGQHSVKQKWNIVQCLGCLLGLEVQHILLSNSTDTAQLLGSFEQINELQPDNTRQPVFKYVDSRLVRMLRQPNTLVYVEVFADYMVERLQKGITQIYDKKCRVIVGCDGLNMNTEMMQFQYLPKDNRLAEPLQIYQNDVLLKCKTTPYFNKPNLTSFESLSLQLNTNNPIDWLTILLNKIQGQIDNSQLHKNNMVLRKKKAAKQDETFKLRLIHQAIQQVKKEIQQQSLSDLHDESLVSRIYSRIETLRQKAYDHSRNQLLKDLAIDLTSHSNSSTPIMIASLTEHMPKDEDQYRVGELTKCLVSSTKQELQRHIRVFDQAEHDRIMYIRMCVLRLFALNYNNFRSWTMSILKFLTEPLVAGFEDQLIRINKNVPHRKQTTVKEDLEDVIIRNIPHMTDVCSIIQYIADHLDGEFPFNELFRITKSVNCLLPSLSMLMEQHEKSLADSIEIITRPIDYNIIGKNITSITIKNYYAYERVFLGDFVKIGRDEPLISVRLAANWLIDELKHLDSQFDPSQFTDEEIGKYLYELFKPHPNINQNLSFYAKQDIEYRTQQQSLEKRQIYLQVLSETCRNRYGGFSASKVSHLHNIILVDQERLIELRKRLVYRGSDNIQDMKLFYMYLISEHQMMVQDHFSLDSIKRFVGNMFEAYYARFRDILFPLLTAVMLIYQSKSAAHTQLPCVLNPKHERPSLKTLVKQFTLEDEVSKFEEDNAKRHILLQKKLHNLIVDEYTEKGVKHHKLRQEEDFKQTFGIEASSASLLAEAQPIDAIYSHMKTSVLDGYKFSLRKLPEVKSLREFAVVNQLLYRKESKNINIYSEPNISLTMGLVDCIPGILAGLDNLMQIHSTDTTRNICLLLNTILQQKILTTELYKILASCQHVAQKLYELNKTIPQVHYINYQPLTQKIIEIRRIQRNNWEGMLTIKDTKIEKADVVELVHLCRSLGGPDLDVLSRREIINKFLMEANLCTYLFRIKGLQEMKSTLTPSAILELEWVIGHYNYFMDEYLIQSGNIKTKIKDKIAETKNVVSWKSTDFLIFKPTYEKFQRQVHLLLKKYEDDMTHTGILTVIESKRSKAIATSISHFLIIHPAESQTFDNDYEQCIKSIFEAINELKQPSHNNQSRLRVLRDQLSKIQKIIPHHQIPKQLCPCFSAFVNPSKAEHYYYSVWDKINQRMQGTWQTQTIEQMWKLVNNAWALINIKLEELSCREPPKANPFGWIERVLADYGWTVDKPQINQQNIHPMFLSEIEELSKLAILHKQKSPQKTRVIHYKVEQIERLYSLLKLSHIIAAITVNLQKEGFCTKEQQSGEGDDEEDGELQAGVGMAEGEVAEGAHNAGDEIDFEEQLQGLRGEKQAENEMDSKSNSNDFQMQGDFNGEVRSQEQKEGQEQEQKPEDLNEQMGSASGNDDFKLDQGQNSEEDQEEKGERKKQEQLQFNTDRKAKEEDNIQAKDEQKPKDKQRNLGDGFEESDQQQGESNMEGGQKLDQDRMNQEEEDSVGLSKQQEQGMQVQSQIDDRDEGKSKSNDEMDLEEKEDQQNQDSDVQKLSSSREIEKDDQDQMQDEQAQPQQQPQEGQQPQKSKPKVKPIKQKRPPAYGVEGPEQNPMINEQEEKHGDGEQDGQQQQGQQKQERSSTSFSKKFLESVISSAKQADKEKLKRDLNVVDELEDGGQIGQQQQQEDENEQDQDYGLADQSKIKTNLPSRKDQEKQREQTRQEPESQQEHRRPETKHERQPTESKQRKQEKRQQPATNKRERQNNQMTAEEKQMEKSLEEEFGLLDAPKFQQSVVKEQLIDSDFEPEETMKVQEAGEILTDNPLKPSNEVSIKLEGKEEIISQAEHFSSGLYEELKAVLQPQQVASYQGDYKTGKKLNMKKIIGFIASNYRKDRIWLRRAQPTDRNYQIHLSMDDTKSMGINKVGAEALKGLMALGLALSRLNIKLSVSRIRDRMTILTGFQELFTEESCRKIVDEFSFNYQDVNSHNLAMAKFMSDSVQYFKEESVKNTSNELHQICFILSDGRFNKEYVRPYLNQAQKLNQTYIFIIVDRKEEEQSILSIKSAVMGKDNKFVFKRYMDDFPFEYYLIVKDVSELSGILADVLRQYFEQK